MPGSLPGFRPALTPCADGLQRSSDGYRRAENVNIVTNSSISCTNTVSEDSHNAFDPPDSAGDSADAEDLLRRALLDESSAVSVSLKIDGLPVSRSVTVIFYARRDLGTLQTFVAPGIHGAGSVVSLEALMRVPCDLDLADAEDRDEAERIYAEQARTLRDAVVGADIVLDVWRDPLAETAGLNVEVDRSVALPVRLRPAAAADGTCRAGYATRRHTGLPRTDARRRAPGPRHRLRPAGPRGRYALSDDPESCVIDFLDHASSHARSLADRIAHQEASVERFLELSDAA